MVQVCHERHQEGEGAGVKENLRFSPRRSQTVTKVTNMKGVHTMKNVTTKLEGTKLTIEIDLEKEFGPSSSGKSVIIASSEGNKEVAPGVKMGLNIYKATKVAATK